MPIQFNEENCGKILVIHVSGKLVKADYPDFVAKFEQLVQQHGKLRVLFDMTRFHGWDVGAAWEDFKFDIKHYADIERLAMVGEKKWQHGMAMFFKPFTKATTRYISIAPLLPKHGSGWTNRKWPQRNRRATGPASSSQMQPRGASRHVRCRDGARWPRKCVAS